MGYEHIDFKDGFIAIHYNGLAKRSYDTIAVDGEQFVAGFLETDDFSLAVYRKCNKYGERKDKQ